MITISALLMTFLAIGVFTKKFTGFARFLIIACVCVMLVYLYTI